MTLAPTPTTTLRRHPSVLFSPHDAGYVAFDVRALTLHRLNPAAALVLELCDGTRTRDELRACLASLNGSRDDGSDDDQSADDGNPDWIDTALAEGLIEDADPASDAPLGLTADELSTLADRLRDEDRVLPAFLCQQRASELAPHDPTVWLRLGELAHIVGRREIAREAYTRYLDQHPDDAEVEHILIALRGHPAPARASDRCIATLYERFASFYDENMTGELDYRAPELVADALATATRPSSGLGVLDLGCGTGLSGVRLRPLAARLVGVDLSAAMIERAAARAIYDDLHTSEITAWLAATHPHRYDAVVLCDTLIYFGDLGQVVSPAARLLAEEGAMVFTVERTDRMPYRLNDSGRYAHHERHIRATAAAAGLEVARLDACVLRYEYGDPVTGYVAVLRHAAR